MEIVLNKWVEKCSCNSVIVLCFLKGVKEKDSSNCGPEERRENVF